MTKAGPRARPSLPQRSATIFQCGSFVAEDTTSQQRQVRVDLPPVPLLAAVTPAQNPYPARHPMQHPFWVAQYS